MAIGIDCFGRAWKLVLRRVTAFIFFAFLAGRAIGFGAEWVIEVRVEAGRGLPLDCRFKISVNRSFGL